MRILRTKTAAPVAMLLLGLAMVAPVAAQDRVVAYQIVDASEIPTSLTGVAGDVEAGRKLFFDRERTGCSGCHGSPGGPGAVPQAGREAAPKLDGVSRRLSAGAIRLWLVAPQVISPGTAMPGYYTVGQRTDPQDPRYGESLLSAAEIENIVAYLMQAGR